MRAQIIVSPGELELYHHSVTGGWTCASLDHMSILHTGSNQLPQPVPEAAKDQEQG